MPRGRGGRETSRVGTGAACSTMDPVQEPLTPVIIELAEPATEEITVADILIGAFSFAGVLLLVAVGLAVLFAGGLIGLRRLRPENAINGETANQTSLGLHLPPGQ